MKNTKADFLGVLLIKILTDESCIRLNLDQVFEFRDSYFESSILTDSLG